ncbi:MAG: hypothetical protein EOP06_01075 [Proteobacteria bacterium]|nr:MAG: hypothetical protein EOP06_01075 [Pseudomonadota bacterium]
MPFIEQYLAEFSRSFSFDILKLPLLILSVILLCSYIYLYFKTKHWPMLLASLLPLYLCYVSIDHYVFYRDKQWIISYAPEINSAVDCKGLVAMRMENGTANYRCMKAIFIGSKLGTPMIGWPDYRSGESVDFYNRVTAEMAKAEDPKL